MKELYDSLYKANISLMRDQKDLETKYSKLLKAYNKQNSKANTAGAGRPKAQRKPTLPSQNASQILKRRSSSRNNSKAGRSKSKKRSNRGTPQKVLPHDSSIVASYVSYNQKENGSTLNESRTLQNLSINTSKNEESILFSNSLIQRSVKPKKKKGKAAINSRDQSRVSLKF